jgi:outer membrane receptor protein involved in Fe transport
MFVFQSSNVSRFVTLKKEALMKSTGRGNKLLPKWIIVGILIILSFLVFNPGAKAAVTGKIAGVIIDAETHEPLPGANIIIEGTDKGTAADMDGSYYILNLQPGIYNVQARMMGYESVTMTEVSVSAGHTTPLSFELASTVIEGKGVVVKSKMEIIKMDISASSMSAGVEEIKAVPLITDVKDYLNMQAGVEGWEIRGGSKDQTQLMTDGLFLVDNRVNEPIMTPNLSSIKEVQLLKGGFTAEYGNVRSGVVNIITKEGDRDTYHGSIDFRYTLAHQKHGGPSIYSPDNYYLSMFVDETDSVCWLGPSRYLDTLGEYRIRKYYVDTFGIYHTSPVGLDTFSVYEDKSDWYSRAVDREFAGWIDYAENNRDKILTPEEWRDVFLWENLVDTSLTDDLLPTGYESSRRGKYDDLPDWTVDAGLGGPLPVIGKYLGNMTFFTSYRQHQDAFALPDSRDYYEEKNVDMKLTSHLTQNMKLSILGRYGIINSLGFTRYGQTGWATGDNDRIYLRNGMDIIYQYYGSKLGDWNGDVSLYNPNSLSPFDIRASMGGFTFEHSLSGNTFYTVRTNFVRKKHHCNFYNDVRKRDTTTIRFFGNDTLPDSLRYGVDEAPYGEWVMVTNELGDTVSNHSQRLLGTNMIAGAMGLGQFDTSKVTTYNAKFDITHQMNKFNEIKGGLELNIDYMDTYWQGDIGFWGERWTVAWENKLTRIGSYLQDKIEWEGMIANVGIRADYINTNDYILVGDPNDLSFDYTKYIDDTLGLVTREPAPTKLKISPRLGISFPISEYTKLFFNYGHFYSLPASDDLYKTFYNIGGQNGFFGNPALDLPRTISYEVGFESNLLDQFLFHLAGYYKDVSDEPYSVRYVDQYESFVYNTVENNEYEDIRGFELSVRKPYGRWITGWFNYDYNVRSLGRIGRATYYENPNKNVTMGARETTEYRNIARPVFRAQVSFNVPTDFGSIFGSYRLNFIYYWRAGEYYTFNPVDWDPNLVQDNIQWPSERDLDMSIEKDFVFWETQMGFFIEINNLLDWKILNRRGFENEEDEIDYLKSLHLAMYEHPDWQNNGFLPPVKGQEPDEVGELRSEEKPYINNPNRTSFTFLNPRSISFGIKLNF